MFDSKKGLVFCYLLLFAFLIANNNTHAAKTTVHLSDGRVLTFFHADEEGLRLEQLADLIRSAANATEYSAEEFKTASIQEGLKSLSLLDSARFDTGDRLAVVAYGRSGTTIDNILRPKGGKFSYVGRVKFLSKKVRRQLIDGTESADDFLLDVTRSEAELARFKNTLLGSSTRVSVLAPDDFISVINHLDRAIAKAPALDKPYLYRVALVPKGVMDSAIRPGSYVADFGFMSTTSDIRSLKHRYTPGGGGHQTYIIQ